MFKAIVMGCCLVCCSATFATAESLNNASKVRQYVMPHIDFPAVTTGSGSFDPFIYPDGNTIESAQFLWRLANEGDWSEIGRFLHYLQQPVDSPFASNGLDEEFKDVLWPKHHALNKPCAESASLPCEESTHV